MEWSVVVAKLVVILLIIRKIFLFIYGFGKTLVIKQATDIHRKLVLIGFRHTKTGDRVKLNNILMAPTTIHHAKGCFGFPTAHSSMHQRFP